MPAAVPGVMVDSMSVGVNATQILILRVQPVGRARDGGGSSSADPSGCRFFISSIKSRRWDGAPCRTVLHISDKERLSDVESLDWPP